MVWSVGPSWRLDGAAVTATDAVRDPWREWCEAEAAADIAEILTRVVNERVDSERCGRGN